jgi:hypothetical protein
MNGTTLLTRFGAGIALAVATTVVLGGVAGPAHAGPPTLPASCSGSADTSTYTVGCWGGGGSFRAAATCTTPDGTTRDAHGPWRGTAAVQALMVVSTATCDAGDTVKRGVIQRSAGIVGEPM